jgi:hypothetical protein
MPRFAPNKMPVEVKRRYFELIREGWSGALLVDEDGRAGQAALDGGFHVFPRSFFVAGSLAGVPVPCVSAVAQRRFRSGYELRSVDLHDLAVLQELDRGGQTYSGGNQLA